MATLQQIGEALKRADAAGNVADARQLAAAYKAAQGPAPAAPQSIGDQLSAGFTSGVNAIPFVGPEVLGGLEHLKGMVQGRTAEDVAATDKAQTEANPVASTIGSVAGPAVALAPLGLTSLGARALGLSGGLMSRLGFGALSGAAISGGDTFARGGSPDDIARNAAIGAGLGTVLPAAGAGVKAVWRGVTGNAFDPAEKAIARALTSDNVPVHDVQTRLDALGPDAVVADLGPNLQRQAGALASLPGQAQQKVRKALADRAELMNRRIINDTNSTLGPSPVPSQVDAQLVAEQKALSPAYTQALANAKSPSPNRFVPMADGDKQFEWSWSRSPDTGMAAVKTDNGIYTAPTHQEAMQKAIAAEGKGVRTTVNANPEQHLGYAINDLAATLNPVVQSIDNGIMQEKGPAKAALQKVRAMLDFQAPDAPGLPHAAPVLDPNPTGWLKTRQAIDGMLDGETDTNVRRVLTDARSQIDSALTQHVPGIKAVDAQFSDLAQQREALTKGQQLLDSGRTAPRPEDVDSMLAAATGGVSLRLTQGARAEIQRLVGTTANDLNALKTALKGDGSWNRDRLASLFGQQKADQFLHILERERVYDATNRVVTGNSETAARNAAQGEFGAGPAGNLRNVTLTGIAASAAQKMANVGAGMRRTSTNSRVADVLMSRQPNARTLSAVQRAMAARSARGYIAPAVVPLQITVRGGQSN